jgi:hypothetical protein
LKSIDSPALSTNAKIVACICVVFAAVHLYDFVFHGQRLQNIFGSIGFSLMAYGIFRNDLNRPARDPRARLGSVTGAILVAASLCMRLFA